MNKYDMIERLEKKLTKKRFEHSIGVEYTAGALAMVYGVPVDKALIAGLLHDCAKCLEPKDKIARCERHKLPISKLEYNNPELLHAKLGAYYAKSKYGVSDEEILSAIEFHTTGKPGMSMLEKIVFVADYIEPNRKPLPEIDEIRREAFTDIDVCIVHILKNTLAYLKEDESKDTDDMSYRTYEYYIKLVADREIK